MPLRTSTSSACGVVGPFAASAEALQTWDYLRQMLGEAGTAESEADASRPGERGA